MRDVRRSDNKLKTYKAVFLLILMSLPSNGDNKKKPSQELISIRIAGDIILGGLFPIHEKGETMPCGIRVYNRGVHRLEAMLFAVDLLNANPNILFGITFGVHLVDTCSRDTYALNQSLQFVSSSLNNMESSLFICQDMSTPRLRRNIIGPVQGVIGGSYSSVSIQVANLLRLFHIPQISPASTANTLSDKSRFDLFARTVPPDTFQSTAIVDIIKAFQWTYVSTIHSEGSYGENGIEAFHKEATDRNVCIAASEKVPSNADEKVFDGIISKLQKKPNARVVVLFVRAEDVPPLLEAVKRSNITQPFQWIASDGWGQQTELLEGLGDIANGAITIELQSKLSKELDEYMKSLTPETNTRNPWFEEYWESTFSCTLEKNLPTERDENVKITVCDKNLRLSEKVGYGQASKTQFVIDAVFAFGYAFDALRKDICPPNAITCPELFTYDGKLFYDKYLLNVSFKDNDGREVKFDKQGDGLPRYDILNYQKIENSQNYHYKVVGSWFNKLELNEGAVLWNNEIDVPKSACSLPCKNGMIKKQQYNVCCWVCVNCAAYEYTRDEFTCTDCGPGNWPDENKTSCYALPIQYMRWESVFAIVPMGISILGIIMTLFVMVLYAMNNNTPLVRASGRELSYTLLLGILMCYCNTFTLIAMPTLFTCVFQRFSIGIAFTMMYGALLTKTNRISRIFHSSAISAQPLNYISPLSQVLITFALNSVQFIIVITWVILEPPETRLYYPDRSTAILKCNIEDTSFFFSQLYNMLLIVICTVYAVKTRKIPENFNESKYIGFTMYTTCIIWLAFVPLYFGTGNSYEIQTTTLCISISLSATAALMCLYSPKVYILIFQPDKNVRRSTMSSNVYHQAQAVPTATLTGINPPASAYEVTIESPRAPGPFVPTCLMHTLERERRVNLELVPLQNIPGPSGVNRECTCETIFSDDHDKCATRSCSCFVEVELPVVLEPSSSALPLPPIFIPSTIPIPPPQPPPQERIKQMPRLRQKPMRRLLPKTPSRSRSPSPLALPFPSSTPFLSQSPSPSRSPIPRRSRTLTRQPRNEVEPSPSPDLIILSENSSPDASIALNINIFKK